MTSIFELPTKIQINPILSSVIPSTFIEKIYLKRQNNSYISFVCFSCHLLSELLANKEIFLHSEELNYLKTLSSEKRKKSYLLGRYCAKEALRIYWGEIKPSRIWVHRGIFDQPIVRYPTVNNAQVSISHNDDWGVALSFPEEHPMAVDIECIDPNRIHTIKTQVLPTEELLLKTLHIEEAVKYTLTWTIKEGLSKVLKSGMMTPFEIYEIKQIDFYKDFYVSTFKDYAQYKAISFTFENQVCSLISPKNTELEFDIVNLRTQLARLHKRN